MMALDNRQGDVADQAQHFEQAVIDHGIRRARRALEPDDQGVGICVRCEEDISLDRLRAVPGAIRCLECQQLVEARRRPPRRHGDKA